MHNILYTKTINKAGTRPLFGRSSYGCNSFMKHQVNQGFNIIYLGYKANDTYSEQDFINSLIWINAVTAIFDPEINNNFIEYGGKIQYSKKGTYYWVRMNVNQTSINLVPFIANRCLRAFSRGHTEIIKKLNSNFSTIPDSKLVLWNKFCDLLQGDAYFFIDNGSFYTYSNKIIPKILKKIPRILLNEICVPNFDEIPTTIILDNFVHNNWYACIKSIPNSNHYKVGESYYISKHTNTLVLPKIKDYFIPTVITEFYD